MRLTGVISGSITWADRPGFFGEIFDLVATVETPGISNWTNLSAAAVGLFANIDAAPAEGWRNVEGPSANNWRNLA